MDWIQLTIYTTTQGIEPVSGRLYQLGIAGIEIEDESEFFDFLENNKQFWDYVDDELIQEKKGETKVKVYISDNAMLNDMLLSIKATLAELKTLDTENVFGRLEITSDTVNEEDWANNWKKYYKPIEVGERILIKPEWEEYNKPTDRIIFNINPGLSFGTGTHYSTQLCIEELEKSVKVDDTVLDIGCGSGILSIISLLLGAKNAVAIDIDPNATKIAMQNAKMNNICDDKYTTIAGNVLDDEALIEQLNGKNYDVVLANIVADVIIALSDMVPYMIKDKGIFITSGIIDTRVEDVKNALSKNFEIINVNERGGWAAISCKKV